MSDLLQRTLEDAASRRDLSPHDLATVKRRAGRIRRRRTALSTLGAAALVVAVVVPAGLLADRGTTGSPDPTGPTAPPASPTSLAQVPRGDAPRLSYAFAGRLHLTDGREVPMPASRGWTAWTPLGDGWLATSNDRTSTYDARGRVTETWDRSGPPALSSDGSRVAWPGDESFETSSADGGDRAGRAVPQVLPDAGVAGFLPDGRVVGNDYRTAITVGPDGSVEAVPGITLTVDADTVGGLVSGRPADGMSSVVLDSASGKVLWRDERRAVGDFSADGRLAYALTPIGAVSDGVQIVDARTGTVISSADLGRLGEARIHHVSWEDDTHVLIVVDDPRTDQQAVLRLGTDGVLEAAVPARPADDGVYLFAAS